MANPLLVINHKDNINNFVGTLATLKKKVKGKKAKKVVTKKKTKTKKEIKIEPVRESPFSKGDSVWLVRSGGSWVKTTISKCVKPDEYNKEWTYITSEHGTWGETSFYPVSIFSMMASDANRIKEANFSEALNYTFDGNAVILEVYRTGQKRPWAYYVIPDRSVLHKKIEWKGKSNPYGYSDHRNAIIYTKPVKEISLRLTPISSAPQEILTYLGLHIYNRKWLKNDNK